MVTFNWFRFWKVSLICTVKQNTCEIEKVLPLKSRPSCPWKYIKLYCVGQKIVFSEAKVQVTLTHKMSWREDEVQQTAFFFFKSWLYILYDKLLRLLYWQLVLNGYYNRYGKGYFDARKLDRKEKLSSVIKDDTFSATKTFPMMSLSYEGHSE